MTPFFGNNGRQFTYKFFFVTISLNERDAGCGSFLFTVRMISENIFKRFFREVDPSWICRQLKAQYIFCIAGKLHAAKVQFLVAGYWSLVLLCSSNQIFRRTDA